MRHAPSANDRRFELDLGFFEPGDPRRRPPTSPTASVRFIAAPPAGATCSLIRSSPWRDATYADFKRVGDALGSAFAAHGTPT